MSLLLGGYCGTALRTAQLGRGAAGASTLEEAMPFIIWGPDGLTNPKVEYPTYARARMCARDMARRHNDRGQVFYVCEVLSAHQRQVQMEDFDIVPGCKRARLA